MTVDRRRFLAHAAAAGAALVLTGCDKLSETPWWRATLDSAEAATKNVQRTILPRRKMAQEFTVADISKVFRANGASRVVEAIADDVQHGQVTDFYRAVKAEDGETVVFSFIEWPDKATRDEAWKAIMADESLKPTGEMPFNGQRMFWGGFEKIVDSAESQPIAQGAAPVSA